MKYIRCEYEYRDEFKDFPCSKENVIEYIKLVDEVEVGVGIIGKNIYHPYCDQVYVHIYDEHRRRGYGSSLLNQLKLYSTEDLACSVYSNSDGSAFLKANGFEKLRSCWEYSVSVADLIYSPKRELKLTSLGDLSQGERERVERQMLLDYKFNHQTVSPMSEALYDVEWIKRMLRGADEKWSRVYILNEDIGYIIVGDVSGSEIDVFYVGGNIRDSLLKEFLAIGIWELFDEYEVINLELDSTDEVAMLLKSSFAKTCSESYDTYIYK